MPQVYSTRQVAKDRTETMPVASELDGVTHVAKANRDGQMTLWSEMAAGTTRQQARRPDLCKSRFDYICFVCLQSGNRKSVLSILPFSL